MEKFGEFIWFWGMPRRLYGTMGLEPICFKVHNLVVIQLNNTKLGQMTVIKVVFRIVTSVNL